MQIRICETIYLILRGISKSFIKTDNIYQNARTTNISCAG